MDSGELTVGPTGADAPGYDDRAIQAALLLAQQRGIRRVRVRRGDYLCRNSISLLPGIELAGEGDGTVLRRAPLSQSPIVADVHHYQNAVQVADPDLFPPGTGIRLEGTHRASGAPVCAFASVVGRDGGKLLLDIPYVGENFWPEKGAAKVTTRFPMIRGRDAHKASIKDLQIAAGMDEHDDGGGDGVSLWHSHGVVCQGLYVHHAAGDGIGCEICHDFLVTHCRLERNDLPLHLGSGSLRPIVTHTRITDNHFGFYYCWGVQHGRTEDCELSRNGAYGFSIGFEDSHNVIRRCKIIGNGEMGIRFRPAHYPHQSPVDDLVEDCLIQDNGPAEAPLGILMESASDGIRFHRNTLRETRGRRGTGIRITESVRRVELRDNVFEGFEKDLMDERKEDHG